MAARAPLTAKAAIVKVLTDAGKPMGVPEIIKKAVPLTALAGETPGQTIYSVLYQENKKSDGAFMRTNAKGTFKLNPKAKTSTARAASGSKSKAASKKSAAKKTTARKSSAGRKTRSSRKSGAAA